VVLAGEDVELLREVRELFSSELFRVYLSEDIVGVELGGALKNVIAIACGISTGLALETTQGLVLSPGGLWRWLGWAPPWVERHKPFTDFLV
jgi:glycerol-3-phosphate dehydrogenase